MRRKTSRLGKNNDCLTSHGHETNAASLERGGSISRDVSSQQCRDVVCSRVTDDDDDDDDDYICQASRSRIVDGDDGSASTDTEISIIDSDGDDDVLDDNTGERGRSNMTTDVRPRRTAAVQLREMIAMASAGTSSTASTSTDAAARPKNTAPSTSTRETFDGCEMATSEHETEPPSSQANYWCQDIHQSTCVMQLETELSV
jgi:hypothetical protein